MTETTVQWLGAHYAYSYYIASFEYTNWKNEPGNYIFVRIGNGKWEAIYIGQTGEGPYGTLKHRLPDHGKFSEAKTCGATHIHAHTNHNKRQREREERDLIRLYNPPLNIHYRSK